MIIQNKNIIIVAEINDKYFEIKNNTIKQTELEEMLRFDNCQNKIIYINDININIISYIHNAGYKYNEGVILKSNEYSGYIDVLNKIYFINIRNKNNWIKIINLKNIFNAKLNIENMINYKIESAIKNIIKKYGIQTTFGRYAENIFYNINLKNKYKYKISEKCNDYALNSFYGGLNYINESFKNQIIKNVNIIDINSLYPYIMQNEMLPEYDGVFYNGEYKKNKIYNLYIQHIKVDFKLKKGGIAFLKFNKIDFLDEVINSSDGYLVDLYLTNIDLKLFYENYEINEIYYINGFMFHSSKQNFKEYVNKFYKLRKNSQNILLKKFYKLILNSLFGKFAKKKKLQKKIPVFIEDKVSLKISKKLLETKRGYAPISSFVASYGRAIIIENIKKIKEDFIYTDTDSLHFIKSNNLKKFNISNKIGDFKVVVKNCTAKYLKLKYYILEKNKKYKRVLAGIPEEFKQKISFKNFKKGEKISINKKIIKKGKIVEKQFDLQI